MVDETYGIPVVHHGGDVFGHHSDMMWLPEHGVGAIVLTNGDPGWLIRTGFRRKLLEVLFKGGGFFTRTKCKSCFNAPRFKLLCVWHLPAVVSFQSCLEITG